MALPDPARVFGLDSVGSHLTFKDGTSPSEGGGLIQRFSEDLDVVVDRDHLGFDSLTQGSLRLSPRSEHVRVWKADYELMRESMLYAEAPSLEGILDALGTSSDDSTHQVHSSSAER